jgi:aminocarboxymuconate-semialdehyde decarboxylase
MLKVDAYNHIMPIGFFNRLQEVSPNPSNMQNRVRQVPMMTDLDERFRVMDSFDEYCQILSLSSPPIEISADPKSSRDAGIEGSRCAVFHQRPWQCDGRSRIHATL